MIDGVVVVVEDPDVMLSKARGGLLHGLGVEEVDEDKGQKCTVYGDAPAQMSSGRLLARFLSRFSCYYPKRQGGPNLDEAWAHYEVCRGTLSCPLSCCSTKRTSFMLFCGMVVTCQRFLLHNLISF